MEWYNILTLIVGALGGAAGIVSIYKAKSEKTSVDIANMQQMLVEAHNMFNEANARYEKLESQIDNDRKEMHEYIGSLRKMVADLQTADKDKEKRLNALEKVVNVAWRCKFPQNVQDCPVIQEYEKRHCEECVAGHA